MRIFDFGPPRHFRGGPPALTIADWLLRAAVVGYAIGVTAAIMGKLGSGIGTYAFLELGYSHPQVAPVERLAAFSLLALAIAAAVRPHWAFLLPVTIVILLEAAARWYNGGAPFTEWVILAHALRYGAPLGLLALYFSALSRWLGPDNHLRITAWVLRVAIAVVFAVHGAEALMKHPRFIDYIIGTTHNFTGHFPAESTAVQIMRVIGIVDIIVAALVLLRPHPAVLCWMAFWGLITALARVTTFGLDHHHEVFVRSAHVLAPVAVLFILRAQLHYRPTPADAPKAAG